MRHTTKSQQPIRLGVSHNQPAIRNRLYLSTPSLRAGRPFPYITRNTRAASVKVKSNKTAKFLHCSPTEMLNGYIR